MKQKTKLGIGSRVLLARDGRVGVVDNLERAPRGSLLPTAYRVRTEGTLVTAFEAELTEITEAEYQATSRSRAVGRLGLAIEALDEAVLAGEPAALWLRKLGERIAAARASKVGGK